MSGAGGFRRFGWRLFELEIPANWELAADGGGHDEAYFRLDDERGPRMEIKWERVEPKRRPELDKMVDKLLEKLARDARRRRELRKVGTHKVIVCGHDGWMYHARMGELELLGCSWYCPVTERLFLLHTVCRREEYGESRRALEHALETATCHGVRAWLWDLYGLSLRIPEAYRLEQRQLTVAQSWLAFKHEERDLWIAVGYQGMAILALERYGSVDQWATDSFIPSAFKHLGRIKHWESSEASVAGHRALLLRARKGGLFRKLEVRCYAWHCEESNRLIAFAEAGPPRLLDAVRQELEAMIRGVRCHG